jgi:hypothetical protein
MAKINLTHKQVAELCPQAFQTFLETYGEAPEFIDQCEFFIKFEITISGEHKFTLFHTEGPEVFAQIYEWHNGEWE